MSRSKVTHTEADRAVWIAYVIQSTAEEMEVPVVVAIDLLDRYGLINWLLDGYRSFHTQGFEYMAELISDKLREVKEL